MIIWGKGVHHSTAKDVGNIITKHKEQCAHMMQAQILMALLALKLNSKQLMDNTRIF